MDRRFGAALVLAACGGAQAGDPFVASAEDGAESAVGTSSEAGTGNGDPTGDDATGSSADGAGAGTTSGATPPKLDVAAGSEGPTSGEGCEKIDFLFAIDASPSMAQEQAQLLASFPGFLAAIEADVQGQDHHIMVIDVDAHPQYTPVGGNGFCEDGSCCAGICGDDPLANWCNNEPCGDHSGDCDFTLGAGKDDDADWATCSLDEGARWMTDEQADLASTFACVAEVGTYGHYEETQAAAILAAVGSDLAQPGACNEGFLRDDAVLVVTLISDEEDLFSPGDPPEWFDALVAAKGGDPGAIVVLGLVGDLGQPGSPCDPYDPTGVGAQDAARLRTFVQSFADRGLLGSVCAPDYVPFFGEAVALVDVACDEFEPEG
jgi:hypothetical protein